MVVDGQLVDAPTEDEELCKETKQAMEDPPFGSVTGPQEPLVEGDDPGALVKEPEVELPNSDVGCRDMVMDSLDSEATP